MLGLALCFQTLKVAYVRRLFYIFMGFAKVSPIKTDPPLEKIKASQTGKTVVLDPFCWMTLRFYVPPLGRWSVTDYTTIVFNRASIKTKLLKGAAESTSLELTVQNTSFRNQFFANFSRTDRPYIWLIGQAVEQQKCARITPHKSCPEGGRLKTSKLNNILSITERTWGKGQGVTCFVSLLKLEFNVLTRFVFPERHCAYF